MTTRVVTVGDDTPVETIARTLLENRISAVPVLDAASRLVGIVSEGDLMRREESQTEKHTAWWLALFGSPEEQAARYLKSHGRRASDVMTRDPVTVDESATLEQIADLLERRGIKRVPVLREGALVGIVSRANLLHGLVTAGAGRPLKADDETIRAAILEALRHDTGIEDRFVNVTVARGVVHLWGTVAPEAEKRAASLAAENAIGVEAIEDHLRVLPSPLRSVIWAE